METENQDQSAPVALESDYDSNPFTAAWTGIQKLIKINSQAVVGAVLFDILLSAILVVTLFVVAMALISYDLKHGYASVTQIPTGAPYSFLTSMSDGSIYATLGIGFIIIMSAFSLMQALAIGLGLGSLRGSVLKFGALLKQSVGFILPILGAAGLVTLAVLAGSMAVGLLAVPLGYITIVIGLAAIIAGIYAALRLSFTAYVIIDKHLGPIAAMKDSWQLTRDHVIETVGSGAVALLILMVPDIILSALSRVTEGVPLISGLFALLDAAITLALLIGAALSLAQRYVQIRAVKEGRAEAAVLSPFNYLAIATFLVLTPILSALSPKSDSSSLQDPLNGFTTPTQDTNTNPYDTTLN